MAADYKTLFGIVKDLADAADTHFDPTDLFRRAKEATLPSQPKSDPKILQFQPFDACCSGPFRKAAVAGRMDKADDWTCPKCGALWKATVEDGVRKWAAQPAAMVFKV